MVKHILYVDRNPQSIDCMVTLHRHVDGKITEVFKRLPARSGQRGFTNTDWVRSKSPIPYGEHWMTTRSVPLQMEPKGSPFFGIGTVPGTTTITGPNKKIRQYIGLHMENQYPGSAGCVVIVSRSDAKELFDYLSALHPSEKSIEVRVL